MQDPLTGMERSPNRPETLEGGGGAGRAVHPDLRAWLEAHEESLAEAWFSRLTHLSRPSGVGHEPLLREFCETLVGFLPGCMSPYRHQVEPLLQEAAELYGTVAARRGLSAGEVIEEFQIIRDVLIRHLHAIPPAPTALSLRELLNLNRVVDRGVTQASVGHTDVLFFSLLHGSGVPESLNDKLLEEVRDQLDALRGENGRVMRLLDRSRQKET